GRCTYADASGGSRTTSTYPASPVELDFVAPRLFDTHRLVAVGWEEQVTMVGRDDRVLHAGGGELPNAARPVVADRVHHLTRLMRESTFAGVVDLLRLHDDDLRTLDLLRQLRGLKAQELVEAEVDELRNLC